MRRAIDRWPILEAEDKARRPRLAGGKVFSLPKGRPVLRLEVDGEALDLKVHHFIGPIEDEVGGPAVVARWNLDCRAPTRMRKADEHLRQLEVAAVAQARSTSGIRLQADLEPDGGTRGHQRVQLDARIPAADADREPVVLLVRSIGGL